MRKVCVFFSFFKFLVFILEFLRMQIINYQKIRKDIEKSCKKINSLNNSCKQINIDFNDNGQDNK